MVATTISGRPHITIEAIVPTTVGFTIGAAIRHTELRYLDLQARRDQELMTIENWK